MNSRKFNYSILYKRCPSGRVLLPSSTLTHSSQHYKLWRWIGMRNLVSRSALSAAHNYPTQERGGRVEMPLFRVVLLQSASSLTQQELRSEYLVVGLLLHELLKVAQCCLHERSDLLRELLNGRAGELLG